MLLLKEHWVGGNLTFFRLSWLSTKKVCLTSLEAKRVILWFFLYFFSLRRLNWMKNHPLESSLYFLDSQNMKTPMSMYYFGLVKSTNQWLYQALFSPLFKLVKTEERPELIFLDSLKFYMKDKEELLSLGYKKWQHLLL